jgi:hypothetical protein
MSRIQAFTVLVSTSFLLAACSHPALKNLDEAPDAPQLSAQTAQASGNSLRDYPTALKSWKSPQDLAQWMGANFRYDTKRLLQTTPNIHLAKQTRPRFRPIQPADFFARPNGICTDLTHFGVQALQVIQPELKPFYLKLVYDPVLVRGHLVSNHWVAGFLRDNSYYFFSDSRYPNKIHGPYSTVEQFAEAYAHSTQRKLHKIRRFDSDPFLPRGI